MRQLPSGLVTFCFVDVEGSTRAFRSDPERYPGALAAHHELVRAAFATAGGVIVETEGDGLFAAFEDAAAAIAGCLDAQLAMAAYSWPPGLSLRSRMGLHADQAVPAGDGYVALGVHQAARVSAAAHGGQVLCSASVVRSASGLPPAAELAELGSYRLKDFDLPAPLFELRHPRLPGSFPPPRAPRIVPGNLRLARTSFVGRDAELSELRALVEQNRMVTILGPGGVGKTRLAYRLASELTDSFAQGSWVVELDAVADPALVTDAVARALPLPAFAGGRPAERLLAFLATRELLLVLDNCEHVLEGAAELVDQLLDVAHGVTVVATSRVPLDMVGEIRFLLGPLGLAPQDAALEDLLDADAVRLFVARARAASSRFGLDAANGAAVSAICRRLDGLPLALELAGARIATLAPGLDVAEADAGAGADAGVGADAGASPARRSADADGLRALGRRLRDEMLAEARQLGDDNGIAIALYCQADIPWQAGDFAGAAALFREAAAAARRAGSDSLAATILRGEAEVSAEGDSARLASSLAEVTSQFRRTGDPFGLAQTLAILAGAELDCGEVSSAVRHAAEGLRIARRHGYAEVGWRHQTLLAWGAMELGQAELGARLLGSVEAALDRAGAKIGIGQGGPADRQRARALAAATVGADRFAELHAEGYGLADDEAVALALSIALSLWHPLDLHRTGTPEPVVVLGTPGKCQPARWQPITAAATMGLCVTRAALPHFPGFLRRPFRAAPGWLLMPDSRTTTIRRPVSSMTLRS